MFLLERSPKALDDYVVVTVTIFAHAHVNTIVLQHALIAFARMFTSSIGVMRQASSGLPLD